MRELFKFSMCSVQPFHCSIFFLKSSLDLKYLDNVICCKDCCANIRFIFLSKWHFLDLKFGSVKSTLHTQNGIQRSLYSDQTEIYTGCKSKNLYNMIVISLYGNETQFTYHETINISYFLNINKFSLIMDIKIR